MQKGSPQLLIIRILIRYNSATKSKNAPVLATSSIRPDFWRKTRRTVCPDWVSCNFVFYIRSIRYPGTGCFGYYVSHKDGVWRASAS